LNLGIWHEDTAERYEDTDDERVDEGGEDGVWCIGRYELAKTLDCVKLMEDRKGFGGTYSVEELVD
jgi:hypothetical protein